MTKLGIAGALWIAAAAFAAVMTITFRTDALQWVVTIAIGAIAAVVGVWLIARPSVTAVTASNGVAVVWIVLYAVLAVLQADELAAWTTDVALAAIGAAAGVVAYRATAKRSSPEPHR